MVIGEVCWVVRGFVLVLLLQVCLCFIIFVDQREEALTLGPVCQYENFFFLQLNYERLRSVPYSTWSAFVSMR